MNKKLNNLPKYRKGDYVKIGTMHTKILSIMMDSGAYWYELEGMDGFYAEEELVKLR